MKTKRTLSVILSLLPIVLAVIGLFATIIWPLNASDTEGWSFVIYLMTVLPIIALIAIPLSVIALILSRKNGPVFARVLSIINLVWAVPVAVYGIVIWAA